MLLYNVVFIARFYDQLHDWRHRRVCSQSGSGIGPIVAGGGQRQHETWLGRMRFSIYGGDGKFIASRRGDNVSWSRKRGARRRTDWSGGVDVIGRTGASVAHGNSCFEIKLTSREWAGGV